MNRKPEQATSNTLETTESGTETDAITVVDKTGRRQFFRRGAAYMAAGSVVASGLMGSGNAYADDCDRAATGEKNASAPNTDSDAGASADPAGCGKEPEQPKISKLPNSLSTDPRSPVGKIKA